MFDFFKKLKKIETPVFVESVDEYTHLKIIKLKGYLDASRVSEIQQFLRNTTKTEHSLSKSILLDFKNVANVDSAMIAGFVKVLSHLKQKNFKFGLMNLPDNLKGMLQIMKLENVFLIFESEKKAFSEILAWSEDWK